MKNAIIPSFILFASIFCHSMKAQESEATTLVMTKMNSITVPSHPASHLSNANSKPRYEFDIKAGQHEASFDRLGEFISANLMYPKQAIDSGVKGKVIVTVEISAEGEIMNPVVTKSLGAGCDEAVLDLLNHMPNWKPAMNYGIPVKTKKVLEFSFELR